MMIETLAKIETQMIQSRKAAKRNQMWKITLKVLIGIFLVVLAACIELIKK